MTADYISRTPKPTSVRRRRERDGFTLTELIVAIAVLVGVLLAVSRIFSTTSKVTGAGEAAADMLTEAAAIERKFRSDIEGLAPEGFFAIRCVAVPNDINWPVLLNPSLPREANIRADQLVFFTNSVQSVQTFRSNAGSTQRGQGTASRVYYGHAFQLGEEADGVQPGNDAVLAFDPNQTVFPWHDSRVNGDVAMTLTRFITNNFDSAQRDMYSQSGDLTLALQPFDARKWLFVRQSVALVNDDTFSRERNAKTVYLDEILTARSIFLDDPVIGHSPQIRDGRVDAAATQLSDIRRMISFTTGASGVPRPWSSGAGGATTDQFSLISSELVYYPRAEREAPGMNRVDQALTAHVLGAACSSIRIDWTYADGVGYTENPVPSGLPFLGVDISANPGARDEEQPWFGLDDRAPDRGVRPYGDEVTWTAAQTIYPDNVEREYTLAGTPVEIYEAIFGFNQDRALNANSVPDFSLGYTPWPTAIRVTLTIHDSRSTMEIGREIQFVIDLPKRGTT